jgi:cytochrome b6-f complex iron-sulfur subunit
LTGAVGIAAGVAAVIGIEQVAKSAPKTAKGPLVEKGTWKPVKALADLPEDTPINFRSGAIEGFLTRSGDQVTALSAVCTHMGCILNYSKFRDRFECPCHGATFEKDGHPTNYSSPLSPLPSLQVRVAKGQVEVYTA